MTLAQGGGPQLIKAHRVLAQLRLCRRLWARVMRLAAVRCARANSFVSVAHLAAVDSRVKIHIISIIDVWPINMSVGERRVPVVACCDGGGVGK